MSYQGRNQIYESVIRNMVMKSLEEQEKQFEEEHSSDSDEMLLEYIRKSAAKLHHVPWKREILGGSYREKRFGTYKAALRKAELPNPKHADILENFSRIQKEVEIQKEAYRKRKAEKKLRSEERRREHAAKRRERSEKQAESV